MFEFGEYIDVYFEKKTMEHFFLRWFNIIQTEFDKKNDFKDLVMSYVTFLNVTVKLQRKNLEFIPLCTVRSTEISTNKYSNTL